MEVKGKMKKPNIYGMLEDVMYIEITEKASQSAMTKSR